MKLHLGCGKRYLPGFLHVDLAEFPHIKIKTDLSDLSMFDDGSIDLIYCSHSLEYYDRIQVCTVLKEWYRVLRGGGRISIISSEF